MPTIADIRRAIRRLGAGTPTMSARKRNELRGLATRCLRLDDAVLRAIVSAFEADPHTGAGDVYAASVETSPQVTYNHVRTVRMALGFSGRGKEGNNGLMAMSHLERKLVSKIGILEGFSAMPGRLRAQLDQLPESEQRKVLAGWAK